MNKKITIGSRGSKLALLYAQKAKDDIIRNTELSNDCLLYTSPSPRDKRQSRMPSSA